MRGSRRQTIVDVAQRAGVSKSTAARALSNAPEISEQTRAKVLEAAQALGYERNHLAVGMRSGRSGMLGLVIPDIANPFWAEVARGAQDRAEMYGRAMLIFSSDWSVEREKIHLRSVRQARVEGIILNRVAERTQDARLTDIPMVMIGSSAALFPDIDNVGSNIEQGVRLAADYLRQRGHLRPCLIVGPRQRLAHSRFMHAIGGFYGAYGLTPDDLIVEEADYTPEGGAAAMERIMARHGRGQLSVLAVSDLIALGALMAARRAGLDCPRDVSIIGFDGIQASSFSTPGLTTVQKPGRAIGATSVDMLIDQIEGRAGEARSISLNCKLIERGSVLDRVAAAEPEIA